MIESTNGGAHEVDTQHPPLRDTHQSRDWATRELAHPPPQQEPPVPHPTMSEVACGVRAVFVFKENRDQLLGAFADTITNEPGATFEELMRRSFEEALAELAARGIMIKAAGIKE